MFSFIRSAALGAAVLAVSGLSASAAVTFQDGTAAPFGGGTYDGTQDAHLYWSSDSQINTGGNNVILSGGANSHILLKFDVSSLAGQGTIQSATLRLYQRNQGGSGGDFTFPFNIYQVADANAGWLQGGSSYAAALPGEVCWDYLSYDATTPTEWAGAGPYTNLEPTHGNRGVSVSGTDFIATPLAIGNYTQDTSGVSNGHEFSINIPVSAINHWIGGPNAGMMILADVAQAGSGYASFFSSDEANIALRPALDITFAPVPEPTTGAVLLIAGSGLLLRRRMGA
ncbi:MAG: PEP-CTERM sorting domain-containing protein [Phycisphaerales bacterium]|nr:PEP-CTERM sorting domain-containing protein [Phycisphaerales bacterium]